MDYINGYSLIKRILDIGPGTSSLEMWQVNEAICILTTAANASGL